MLKIFSFLSSVQKYIIVALAGLCVILYLHGLRLHGKFEAYKVQAQESLLRASSEAYKITLEKQAENDKLNNLHAAEKDRLQSELDAALFKLRNPVRPRLQPASTAPTECRNYEAPAYRLSEADREFLIRIGAEADQVAAQLKAAQQYIDKVVNPNGRTKDLTAHGTGRDIQRQDPVQGDRSGEALGEVETGSNHSADSNSSIYH